MYLPNVHILPLIFVCQCCVNFVNIMYTIILHVVMNILNVYCLSVAYPYHSSVNVVLSIVVEKSPMYCNFKYNNTKLWSSPFLNNLIECTRTGRMKQTPGINKCLTNYG